MYTAPVDTCLTAILRVERRSVNYALMPSSSESSWLRKVANDPTTLATLVMAIFTVILTRQSCKQTAMTVATEHPVITVNTAILTQDIVNGWCVSFPYKNSGRWPARYVQVNVRSYTSSSSSPGSTLFTTIGCAPADDDILPMGPQDGYQWSTPISPPLSQDQITDVHKGALRLYLVGCIGYRDDLGNPYRTSVCQVYLPNPSNAPNAFGLCTLRQEAPQPNTQPNAQPNFVPVEPD